MRALPVQLLVRIPQLPYVLWQGTPNLTHAPGLGVHKADHRGVKAKAPVPSHGRDPGSRPLLMIFQKDILIRMIELVAN